MNYLFKKYEFFKVGFLPVIIMLFSTAANTADRTFASVSITKTDTSSYVHSGIYVVNDWWKKALSDSVWSSPIVDGVDERIFWSDLEPAENQYDWKYMDSEFATAVAHHKKITLGIMGGDGSPHWVMNSGIPIIHFTEIPKEGHSSYVNQLNIPLPWDPRYLKYWNDFIRSLSKHLQSHPDYWNSLAIMKITGFNEWRTDELRLPAEQKVSNGKESSTDAPAIWSQAGYRPSLIIKTFCCISDTIANYFPDKELCLPIISGGFGFPPIDESGRIYLNTTQHQDSDLVSGPIIRHIAGKYQNRFMIMYEGLTDKHADGGLCFAAVRLAQKTGAIMGYQLSQQYYKFPACLKSNIPCDQDAFYAVLANGLSAGAKYFELYPQDIAAYAQAIEKARQKF